jgi:4-amino-4-deoxy-L-arabinose transferase-like glycosyltransferase
VKILLFFLGLLAYRVACTWDAQLSEHDGPRVAGIAREMALTGDVLIPRLDGETFLEYPSLGYLPIALALSMSRRPPDWLAVVPSAFIGTATAFFTFLLGRRLGGMRVGLSAALILSSSAGFFVLHRRCLADVTLLLCITISLWGFAAGWAEGGKRFRFYALFYLGMGCGFLSKGLLGAVIPAAVVAAFLVARLDLPALRGLRLHWGALLIALPILVWGGAAALRDGAGPLQEVFRQSVSRFLSSSADHAQRSPFYYLPHASLNLLPWTALLLVLFIPGGTPGWRRRLLRSPLGALAAAWILVTLLGLSLASAKRVVYLAPLYPAFALLAALLWDQAVRTVPALRRLELPGSLATLLTFGVLHFAYFLPTERAEGLRPLFEIVEREAKEDRPVFLYQPNEALRGAAVFYLGRRAPVLFSPEALEAALADRSEKVLVAALPKVEVGTPFLSRLPGTFHPIGRRRISGRWVEVYSNL